MKGTGDFLKLEDVTKETQDTLSNLRSLIPAYERRMELFEQGITPERVIEAMVVLSTVSNRANNDDFAINQVWGHIKYEEQDK